MKFNFIKKNPNQTINHEGAEAYTLTPAMELYAAVVTASLSDSFYEKASERLQRIRTLIAKNDAEFVAKLAIYTREKMYLRSVPLVLAVELAKVTKGNAVLAKAVERVIQRADEITELLAYYALANERKGIKQLNKLSKQLQKGLAGAFNKFDEYQFAKYNRDAAVKMRDALFLIHPKAKDEAQQAIFDKIVRDELAIPYTWETELSALGQVKYETESAKQKAFKTKWEELIDSKKLGYMAILRNLRNILEAEVSSEHIKAVCAYLCNENAVKTSKQLPFRFLAAYRELKKLKHGRVGMVLDALEEAIKVSIRNMQGFDAETRVVIACDVSGSMQTAVSPKSQVMMYDIGLVLGMLLQSKCQNVVSGIFGDKWKIIQMPSKNILSNVDEFYKREGEVGYSTNGYLVIQDLINRKYIADKVMIFTDCQMWNSNATQDTFAQMWNVYRNIAPKAKLYLFNLQGYQTVPLDIKQQDVYLIGGWSDKIFDVLRALEDGKNNLNEIQKIEL